jgi:cobalt-precorrin 5A hydrolase
MKTAVVSLTLRGAELALKIGYQMKADIYVKNQVIEKYVMSDRLFLVHPVTTEFSTLIEKLFNSYDALVFVMACGIVVRSIAPYIKDKVNDPAVLVVDEKGQHVISLLSGHIGGANKLAKEVARLTGGVPVITTATDVNNVIAFDVFAVENGCIIENIKDLKYISSELVNGGEVGFYTDCTISGTLPENVIKEQLPGSCKYGVVLSNVLNIPYKAEKILIIRPKNLILGIGCRKGTSTEAIENAVEHFLNKNNKSLLSIKYLASIDLKKEEKGIVEFCKRTGIEFRTFSAEVIKSIEDRFTASTFVKKSVGVGSVSEACAVMGGNNAKLICPKTVYKGITLALAEEERVFYI